MIQFGQAIARKIDAKFSGPVGIIQQLAEEARLGWTDYVRMLWVLSAYLAPFNLAPLPALLTVLLSLALVLTGTLYSTWRAATVSPMSAMR